MNSTVEDMNQWLKVLLAQGSVNSQSLIGPATFQELIAAQIAVPGAPECTDAALYSYGMGWSVASYRGHYYVSHDGISDGFTTAVGFLPSEKIAIIITANKNMASLPRYISFQMMDRMLGLPFHDWLQEGKDGIKKNKETRKEHTQLDDRMRKKGTLPSHALEDFVGVYENPGYGVLAIELIDGKLHALFNDLEFVLNHWHYDTFNVEEEKQAMIITMEGTKFSFCNDAQGDINTLLVPFECAVDDIVFKRKPKETLSTLNYLRQFIGTYEMFGYVVEMVVRNHTLMAIIPGQPNYELVPTIENEFIVKAMTGTSVRFVMDEGKKIQEILLVHPYGTFSATPKK